MPHARAQVAIDAVAEQAIDWMVLLRSGAAGEADVQAFQAWRAAHPAHDAACRRIEGSLGGLRARVGASSGAFQQALMAPATGRRKLLGGALALAGVGVVGNLWVAEHYASYSAMLADASTATAERKFLDLPDGSTLVLDARSAVDWRFNASTRRVRLRTGRILTRVRHDQALMPFVLETAFGTVSTVDAAFQVALERGVALVSSLGAELRLETGSGKVHTLRARQSARMSALDITDVRLNADAASAWTDGLLEVRDEPLHQVIEALRPYRLGVIRLEPSVADLRVSGLFSLNDSDAALKALAQSLPVTLKQTTPYWVSIGAR